MLKQTFHSRITIVHFRVSLIQINDNIALYKLISNYWMVFTTALPCSTVNTEMLSWKKKKKKICMSSMLNFFNNVQCGWYISLKRILTNILEFKNSFTKHTIYVSPINTVSSSLKPLSHCMRHNVTRYDMIKLHVANPPTQPATLS